jgi:hypothetical protein
MAICSVCRKPIPPRDQCQCPGVLSAEARHALGTAIQAFVSRLLESYPLLDDWGRDDVAGACAKAFQTRLGEVEDDIAAKK